MFRPHLFRLALAVLAVVLTGRIGILAAEEDPAAAQRKQVHHDVMIQREYHKLTPANVTDDQIVASMKRAIDYLFKNETKDNWESVDRWSRDIKDGDMKGGETALVLLALLEAGQSIDDPRLKLHSKELAPAIDYLLKLQTDRTYVLGLKASVLALLPQAKDQKFNAALQAIKEMLVAAGEANTGYGYSVRKDKVEAVLEEEASFTVPFHGKSLKFSSYWDNSNSQYALLGVWAAADAGLPVPGEYWAVEDALWRATQCKSGAWCYSAPVNHAGKAIFYGSDEVSQTELPATTFQRPTLTAAGLASLYVTQEFLDTEVRTEPKPDPVLTNGLKNFTSTLDPCYANGYYLYGIERVGLASGYKYFGATDWYREIACTLLATQQDAGAWQYQMDLGTSPNVGTAYGLLTLARGRNPILINKLAFGSAWNARPRDVANLTRWMSKTFERPLNWQIVNLDVPGEEWLDAPILYITGSRDPNFTKEQLAKLKTFVDGGGMILSNPDANSEPFTAAVKKYAAELTGRHYEMRVLPKDHPIFSMQYDIKAPPTIWGLSNGSRELWLHMATDNGAVWQRRTFATKMAFELPANIYFYATGHGKLQPRLQPLTPTGGDETTKITVGLLEYAGNWDPEPGAWPRFASLAKAGWSTGVTLQTVKPADLDPAKTPLVHLTGSAKVTFTPEETAALKSFVEKGGTLLIDSAGGAPAFAQSAEEMIKALGVGNEEPLFAEDPLFTAKKPGMQAVKNFEYRGPVLQKYGGLKPSGPLLKGVKVNGRWGILFSAEDLASGFLGTHTWITGYEPDTSVAIVRNILMDLAKEPPPKTAP